LRELRIEETNRPLKKVTDYSSSSEESESSDEEEEDGESETHDGTVAVSDIPRLIPTGAPGATEQYNVGMVGSHGLETSHADTFSSSISREGTLMIRETSGEKKRSGHSDSNGFAGHINLPDLVQQSHSPAGTPTEGLGRVSTHSQEMDSGTEYGMGSSTKASFTPFVDPRVYQTSPTDEDEEDEESSAAALFTSELLRQEQALSGVQPARTPPMLRPVDPQIPHLVAVKSQGPALTASQSVHEQPTKGLSGFQEALNVTSHRVEMPRQNSDPTSENPPLPTRIESNKPRSQ